MPGKPGPRWTPTPEDCQSALEPSNPWIGTGLVPDSLAPPTERPLVRFLWQRLLSDRPRRDQVLLGPRRTGKSTCLVQVVRRLLASGIEPHRIWRLNMDHPLLSPVPLGMWVRHLHERAGATPEAPAFLLLDEVVHAADWDRWLKVFYDEQWPVRVVATSSAAAILRNRRTESGAGRWEERHLLPCLLSEALDLAGVVAQVPVGETLAATLEAAVGGFRGFPDVAERRTGLLLCGGFPETLLPATGGGVPEPDRIRATQEVLLDHAVERAVYRDIPLAYGVDNPSVLDAVLFALAGRMGGLLSADSLCAEIRGLSQPTFDRYSHYLERSFLVFTLPNYAGRGGAARRRGRKVYFVDGAVRNAVLRRGATPLGDPAEMGRLLENQVAGHLHALSLQSGTGLYHWRERNDEVDFIHDHPGEPLAFEVASSAGHHRRGLAAFLRRHPRFHGRCWMTSPGAPPILPSRSADGTGSVPLDLLLVAIGRQAEREMARRMGVAPIP